MGRVSLSPDGAEGISWTIENVIAIAACIPTYDELEHKEDGAVDVCTILAPRRVIFMDYGCSGIFSLQLNTTYFLYIL